MNELVKRSITGILLVLVVVYCSTYSLWSATVLWGSVLVLGLIEFFKLKSKEGERGGSVSGAWMGVGVIVIAVVSVWGLGRPIDVILGIKSSYSGMEVVAFLTWIWANDTFAYIGGRLLGRRLIYKGLAPVISPKKSWEGAVIGAVGAAVAGWFWMGEVGVLLGALTGVLSTCGDLIESAAKRRAGVKDSGSLLPGHGGILDRFDGLVLAAPVVLIIKSLLV
ncbi:MAG TPA: hypothetical protein EYO58_01485 [Flavobacteriales bacterium]|jgi:phosphatidate cytidylyltransferase|nr:hypothetical protein [Flavobacteriales bacterium]